VGKSRSAVTNSLRLLALPQKVRDAVSAGAISEGHARALLAITDRQLQEDLCARIVAEGLSVRAVEQLCSARPRRDGPSRTRPDPDLAALEESLQQSLGTRVRLRGRDGHGEIVVEYHGAADRERLIRLLLDVRRPGK
jgi:ParB family chromosome partitioning protein